MRMLSLSALLLLAMAGPADATDTADTAAVKSVLSRYKAALEKRDLTGVEKLFDTRNEVVESGKVEGGYADYRDHHIGPELGHFASFRFSDYVVKVRLEGPIALATETYRYSIVLKDKPEPIERTGAATSVLKKIGGQWKILSTHSSSRTPKPAKPKADANAGE
ncbi:MAG: nuclear transport factor 2 family protein [Lysobacter sp.]|nr:MAG: nuclear transport factor 2 family protein [Lysobacter sp.]